MKIAVFFGGYRQDELCQPTNAYSVWLEQIGKVDNSIINVWNGRSDDRLIDRWQRAETALDRIEEEKKVPSMSTFSHGRLGAS
jgi:RPA family protein